MEDFQMTAVNTHFLGDYLSDYCKSLALEEIKVEPIPQIIFKAYSGNNIFKKKYHRSYHSAVFKIVDDDNYLIEFDENNAKNK